MKIGFIGLGKMGLNMSRRLIEGKCEVIGFDQNEKAVKEAKSFGVEGVSSLEAFIDKLEHSKVIWLMLPAGEATEFMIDKLIPLLDKKDLIIEGGNSLYKDSMRRAKKLAASEIDFLDVGVSGGIWGLENGYCMMVGGEQEVFNRAEPFFTILAPSDGCALVGANGAGHFVKMIHNGIEYAMLESYAEGFELINAKNEFDIDLEKIANLWNQGSVIRSWLLELAASAFKEDSKLESIEGYVEDSGEGRWTVAEAMNEEVPAPVIALSLFERFRSRQKQSFGAKFIAALRNKFGGHPIKDISDD